MSQADAAKRARRGMARILDLREAMLLGVILAAGAVMAVRSPIFLTWENLSATLLSLSVESIVAVGMTVLIVSGGFDLSVGSTMALAGSVTALCLVRGVPVVPAVLAGLGVGAAVGLANGLIVARIGINPFVTTLAMMSVVRSLVLVVTGSQNIAGLPDSFKALGQGSPLGVQNPILIALAFVVLGDLLLRRSRFFRQNYYIGGNERAAVLSGIPVNRVKVFNYTLVGLLAAFAGILMTSRLGSASLTAGKGLELRVISAVIIGGASLSGGEGTVFGAFLGSLLMAIIVNALTLLGVDPSRNELVIGGTLLLAVVIDTLGKRRKGLG